jgi:hypothetical protein
LDECDKLAIPACLSLVKYQSGTLQLISNVGSEELLFLTKDYNSSTPKFNVAGVDSSYMFGWATPK